MPDLEWGDMAQADVITIAAYIAADNPSAAMALKNDIEEKVSRLKHYPQIGRPGRVHGTRELVIRDNYVVVYKENGCMLTVLRVLHAARAWPAS